MAYGHHQRPSLASLKEKEEGKGKLVVWPGLLVHLPLRAE